MLGIRELTRGRGTGALEWQVARKLEPGSPDSVGQSPFLYIKRHFGFRYRGLSKNTQRLMTGVCQLVRAEQYLAA